MSNARPMAMRGAGAGSMTHTANQFRCCPVCDKSLPWLGDQSPEGCAA